MKKTVKSEGAATAFEVGDFVVWNARAGRYCERYGRGPHHVDAVYPAPVVEHAALGHAQRIEMFTAHMLSGAIVEKWQPPKLTPPQCRQLLLAAKDRLGVVQCWSYTGFARSTFRRMMDRLVDLKLFVHYPHGREDYEITLLGRYARKVLKAKGESR